MRLSLLLVLLVGAALSSSFSLAAEVLLRGEVVDADTGTPLPCRLYIQGEQGAWHFPRSAAPEGSAVPYRKQNWTNAGAVEQHTTLSAHPFEIRLAPGRYRLTVERGKEYFPWEHEVVLAKEPVIVTCALKRWIALAQHGWYSGDTHVHRTMKELPNVMLAEDLNVAFPLLYWVHEAFTPPGKSTRSTGRNEATKAHAIDATHVIYPRNTEYEIFTIKQKRHPLGAFIILNHRTIFDKGTPPVRAIAEQAHRENALIELDKHAWPWSIGLVPIMKVDLYELSNNHIWRTQFSFPDFGEAPADYMQLERTTKGLTEWGWIEYGFKNYYALLNCGFKLRPTAGTASGVHPVPLGFGRVYVQLPEGFSYEGWVRGLDAGRSFVTTGPMLFARVNDQQPGHSFTARATGGERYRVHGSAESATPLRRIDIVVNGEIAAELAPTNVKQKTGAYRSTFSAEVPLNSSSWLCVRCFEHTAEKRIRFAHSGPFHVVVAGKPLRPRHQEVAFLISRVERQIARSSDVLPEPALREYREALAAYRKIAETAR